MLDHAVLDRLEASPDRLARDALAYIDELYLHYLATQEIAIERGSMLLANHERCLEEARKANLVH